jgi:alpha-mannosidase
LYYIEQTINNVNKIILFNIIEYSNKMKFYNRIKLKSSLVIVLSFFITLSAFNQVIVVKEQIKTGWAFSKVMRPSKTDAAQNSKITIAGNKAILSCLSPDGLHNGVLPQECRLLRDFFCFTNNNAKGGKIVMDLGKVIPVAMVNSYSAQGPVGGTTWCEEFDGSRAPQVYTLYGSSSNKPDPNSLLSKEWVKIADVDTRPNASGKDWIGQYGVNIKEKNGNLLGKFRWLVWDVKPTLMANANPNWTNTWYTELDVHTPETQKNGGDGIMAGTQLKEIVVAYKTHFDIGFTHPAPEIVNIYRTTMIDHALKLIDESQQLPADKRFVWTIPSWVAYQMLWDGQDSTRRARILSAIRSGSLVVHGLPVTVHTESLELEDFVFGLSLNTKISNDLKIPLSRSGKMTDIPSHSWILPTVLKHAGIDFLHIGANPVNERPNVPLLYYWEGADGSRLLTMHNQGYGSDNEFGHGLYPPKDWKFDHWLAMLVTSDNQGPPSQKDVENLLKEVERNLPGVKIRFGKMEDFADAIFDEEKQGAKIPVVKADMPDCWIHGVGTMPVEDSIAHKMRSEISAVEILDSHLRLWGLSRSNIQKDLFTAHERSLMFGEHTFGGSRNLEGRNAYKIKDFESYTKTDKDCKWLQKTWDDHADYIRKAAKITDSLAFQEVNQLAAAVAMEGKRMVVYNPLPWKRDALVVIPNSQGKQFLAKDIPACGYKTFPLNMAIADDKIETSDLAILENKYLKVKVNRKRGGVVSIIEKKTGRELVDSNAKYAFGQYFYERFDSLQNLNFHLGCSHLSTVYGSNGKCCRGWNVRADLPSTPSYQCAVPEFNKMIVISNNTATEVVLTANANGIIQSKVTTTITLPHNSPWIEIAVRLDDKKPDYWPETGSMYLPVKARNPQFRIGRVGAVVNPAKDFASGSNRTYGYVNTGAMIADKQGKGVGICPLDQGIMSFGDKGICTIDPDYVPTKPLALVSMYNNIWTTNFPYWIKGTLSSRVRIWATDNLKDSSLVNTAIEARNPVLVGMSESSAGKLPSTAKGLELSRNGIRMTTFSQNGSGGSSILRLWEVAGESGNVTVILPAGAKFTSAQPINLRGVVEGKPIAIRNDKFIFRLDAYAPASFVLQ